MSSEPVIVAEGLGKCYPVATRPGSVLADLLLEGPRRLLRMPSSSRELAATWALRGVDFSVDRGETFGIVGSNGAGKSTLLQLLCGTLEPSEGAMSVRGRVAALLELGAGFNPEFSGRENARLNAALLGLNRLEVEARLEGIEAFADIGEYIDMPTKTYSSGMYVRLAFAVATSVDADVLIVDEALAVGDARFQARCMKRIRAMRDAGTSILFVSHDVSTVRQLCDRALWLDHGRQRMLGNVLSVTSRYMEALFSDEQGDAPEDSPESGQEDAARADEAQGPPLDPAPVSRWGIRPGLIHRVDLIDARTGKQLDVVQWGTPLVVSIQFHAPDAELGDGEVLSVAFSFKDTNGTDIVVSSTAEAGRMGVPALGENQSASVEFQLDCGLVPGRYIVVAALEKRTGTVIEYFDYIEGARFFAVLADARHFGLYQPAIGQSIKVNRVD
jgi:lipopolysaccharide transport system ATP-binding protein